MFDLTQRMNKNTYSCHSTRLILLITTKKKQNFKILFKRAVKKKNKSTKSNVNYDIFYSFFFR